MTENSSGLKSFKFKLQVQISDHFKCKSIKLETCGFGSSYISKTADRMQKLKKKIICKTQIKKLAHTTSL